MISRDCTHQNFRVNYFLKEEPDPNNFVIQRHFTRSLFHMSTFWNPIPGIGWNVIRSLESGDISPDPKSRWADCMWLSHPVTQSSSDQYLLQRPGMGQEISCLEVLTYSWQEMAFLSCLVSKFENLKILSCLDFVTLFLNLSCLENW